MFAYSEHIQTDLFGQFDLFKEIKDTLMHGYFLTGKGLPGYFSK